MNITFKGNPVTLVGNKLKVGDTLNAFTTVKNDLSPLALGDTNGVRIFLSVPSLDTAVCEQEVNTFNKRASEISGVTIYTVSMDLPFAQARWCGTNGVNNVITISDYKDKEFAKATGTCIKEIGLLTRAVFVVNNNNELVYVQYVSEITDLPNFDEILNAAKNI